MIFDFVWYVGLGLWWCARRLWLCLCNYYAEVFAGTYRVFCLVLHFMCYVGAFISFTSTAWFTDHICTLCGGYRYGLRSFCGFGLGASMFFGMYLLVWIVGAIVLDAYRRTRGDWLDILIRLIRVLGGIGFPIASVYLGTILKDVASLWTCVFTSAAIFSQLVLHDINDDLGSSDAFTAVGLGIIVNLHLEHTVLKCFGLAILGAFKHIGLPFLGWIRRKMESRRQRALEMAAA